jgi:hypothetical protein
MDFGKGSHARRVRSRASLHIKIREGKSLCVCCFLGVEGGVPALDAVFEIDLDPILEQLFELIGDPNLVLCFELVGDPCYEFVSNPIFDSTFDSFVDVSYLEAFRDCASHVSLDCKFK